MDHADFNAISREIFIKLEIYFDEVPLIVTRDNFLIDIDILEESGVTTANPLGAISANEIAFKMFNTDGMFTPTNFNGPYYGKIKVGTKIKPFISLDNKEWLQMSEYFVSDWKTTITSSFVNVTAHNIIRKILNEPMPHYPVRHQISFDTFFTSVFNVMGYDIKLEDNFASIIEWAYITSAPKSYLSEMTKGAMAICTVDRYGDTVLRPWKFDAIKAIPITDADQIKSIKVNQSILRSYNGVELKYIMPQITPQEELLKLESFTIPSGVSTYGPIAFKRIPVRFITWIAVNAQLGLETDPWLIEVTSYSTTTEDITFTIRNHGNETEGSVIVYGIAIDLLETVLTDENITPLRVKNVYIQNLINAISYRNRLIDFVASQVPELELEIRGDALYNIGDSVVAYSERYNLVFAGIIQSLDYNYNGGLSCKMTLLNAEIVENVFHPDLFVNFSIINGRLYFEYPNGMELPVPFPFEFEVNDNAELIVTTTEQWPNPFSLDDVINLIYTKGLKWEVEP